MKAASLTLVTLLVMALAAASLAQAPAASAPAASPAPAVPPASTPAKASEGMEGLGAVYSDKLAGRKTANGEVFSQGKLTAAHPSLPFGTRVKVTNIRNNRTVEVRINDRGPKQAGRVIDLSSAAAAKIGIGKRQMMPVKLEVVGEATAKRIAK